MKDRTTREKDAGFKHLGHKVYMRTVMVEKLPHTGHAAALAHGIAGLSEVVRHEGYITDGKTHLPLPHHDMKAVGRGVGLSFTSDHVMIATGIDLTAFSGHVTIWYTKG